MGKKGNDKEKKSKMTKKEKKQANHLRLVQGKKGTGVLSGDFNDKKKAA